MTQNTKDLVRSIAIASPVLIIALFSVVFAVASSLAPIEVDSSLESNAKLNSSNYSPPSSLLSDSSISLMWVSAEQLMAIYKDYIGKLVILVGVVEEVTDSYVMIGSIECEVQDQWSLARFWKGDGVEVRGYVGLSDGTVIMANSYIDFVCPDEDSIR